MDNPETAEFLCGLDGTAITLDPPSEPPLHLPRQTWVIDKTLSERSEWMTQQDVDDGLGLPYAAAKFLCPPKEILARKLLCGFIFKFQSLALNIRALKFDKSRLLSHNRTLS
ncbi:hypothetical protein DTO013E5_7122 [Penicillium roqueforti]|nr:hypothetical protein DTO012A1_8967 [Penicillium roqueforti]KAI2750044.1 hypothetical protein DTO013F2_4879 [Penicillium roqueforti]KAI2768018.1 hypothetical protein DTO012A8_6746 [Penicillium roqueforti]KAI3090249.1 hypothetical protein CBS147338_9171 [Penicillium roqueforti]KAI3187284.1 hypothetical protein DTO032C6_4062 [Penicillium roqueforti]